MSKLVVTSTLCLASIFASAQGKTTIAKSSSSKIEDTIPSRPSGFPIFIDTGNPVEDEKTYRLAKEKFMLETYGSDKKENDQINYSTNSTIREKNANQKPKNLDEKGRKIISKVEFEQYPQEKKEMILAQPTKFVIQ